MYAKILVPLDGSLLSERILPYARSFAEAFQCSVELIHVIDPDTIDALVDAGRGRLNDTVSADLTKTSEEYLARVARSFFESSTFRCTVETGAPAESIIRRAQADSGTLVAMSTRGHSGLKRGFGLGYHFIDYLALNLEAVGYFARVRAGAAE